MHNNDSSFNERETYDEFAKQNSIIGIPNSFQEICSTVQKHAVTRKTILKFRVLFLCS